jgi:hypothetical protein
LSRTAELRRLPALACNSQKRPPFLHRDTQLNCEQAVSVLEQTVRAAGYRLRPVPGVELAPSLGAGEAPDYQVLLFDREEDTAQVLAEQPELLAVLPLRITCLSLSGGVGLYALRLSSVLAPRLSPRTRQLIEGWERDLEHSLSVLA